MRHVFGPFELDTRRYRLRRGNTPLPLDRKAFDTLLFLIECSDRVVSKEELLEKVWTDTSVVEGVVPAAIRRIRLALGQGHGSQQPIETVHGRGYRLATPVTSMAAEDSQSLRPVSSPPPSADLVEPFVGRDDIVTQLTTILREAQGGHGKIVLFTGEPGVGKTRAAEQVSRLARGMGMSVWTARCYDDAGAPAFAPWARVLRTAIAERPAQGGPEPLDASELAPVLPELARADARNGANTDDPVAARYHLYEGISRFLSGAASQKPRLIVFDDLQWADLPTLRALAFVAARITEVALVIVATLRDEDIADDGAVKSTFTRLRKQPGCVEVPIPRLSRAAVNEYLRTSLPASSEPETADWVFRATGGNAFALRELVRALRSAPDRVPPRATASDSPGAARELVRGLSSRLSAETRVVLEAASVFGRPFATAALARVAEVDERVVRTALDEASRASAASQTGRGDWELSHDLFRETIYGDLGPVARARLHLKAALALEDLGAASSEVASHLHRALPHADAEKTVQHAVRAAEAAAAVHAHDEAARFYGIALDAVRGAPDVPPARLADLWILLARALVAAGRSAEAEDAALHVRSLAARAGAPALLAEAGLALRPTGRLWQSGDVVSRAMLDDALPGLPDDARALRARALSSLSMSLPLTISDAMRHDLVVRAVDASRGVSDPATIALVHAARLNALLDPAKVDALVGAASEVVEVAVAERLPELEISARTLRALGLLTRGEIDLASTEYDEIHRVSTEVKNPLTVWRADVARAGIALGRGGLAEAEAEFRSLYARGRRFHGALANLVFRAQMQELDALRGRAPAPTRFDPDSFVERFDWAGATVSSYVALHQLDAGDRASAERAFERLARDDFGGIPRSIGYLAVLRALAFVAIGLGDLPRAERIHADLSPHAHLNAIATSSLYYGPVSYLLGRLEVLLGRTAAARGHFEQAYESAAASRMQPMMARSQEALGTLLAEKGGAEGRVGERHLEEAAALARRLGLGALRLV